MRISWLYSLPLSASALYNLLALLLPLWKDASKPSAKDLVSRSISVPARLPTEQVGVGLNPLHWMPWLPWSCSSSYQNENATFLFWHGVGWFVWQREHFISWLALGFLLSCPFSSLTPTPTTPSVRRILVLLTYNLCFLGCCFLCSLSDTFCKLWQILMCSHLENEFTEFLFHICKNVLRRSYR